MKKAKLLIALLVMLVAASGYAQDSYREAVKNYLMSSDQMGKTKSMLSQFSILFDKNGPVDIDQLTNRYLDEQYENDLIDFMLPILKGRGLTETDLNELSSLLSRPENKTFQDHQVEWMSGVLSDWMMPFLTIGQNAGLSEDEDTDEDWGSGSLMKLLGPPVKAKDGIDAAYAAKFKDVILESAFAKNLVDEMLSRMLEVPEGETVTPEKQKEQEALTDWMNKSMRNLLLNNAYGTITLEDLDFASELYSNESYCKLEKAKADESEAIATSNIFTKYKDWMTENGATESKDPEAAGMFMKLLFGQMGLDFDDNNNLDDIVIDE